MKYIKKNDIISSTYHFIRNNNDQKYRNIKFFSTNLFEEQLNFFIKKFNIIDSNSLLEILSQKKNKSKKPFMLLTFDDGYIDHYKYVYPLLLKKRLKGGFELKMCNYGYKLVIFRKLCRCTIEPS